MELGPRRRNKGEELPGSYSEADGLSDDSDEHDVHTLPTDGDDDHPDRHHGSQSQVATRPKTMQMSEFVLHPDYNQGTDESINEYLGLVSFDGADAEATEQMLQRLRRSDAVHVRQTYLAGRPAGSQVSRHAAFIRVGITFLPGSSRPEVARLEQPNDLRAEPDQQTAAWRVETAASLLTHHEIHADMSISQTDRAPEIAAKANENNKPDREKRRRLKRRPSEEDEEKALTTREQVNHPIVIDSNHVKIVNDLRNGDWDVEATLIEVDEKALLYVMFNCRKLMTKGGPEMTFAETRKLLEMMIEDARRLFVRSPILFRMSTRRHITNSKDTRYGANRRERFQTVGTSAGIRQIISLGASYFDSLYSTDVSSDMQRYVRPRFLQMIVLLLSLLNNKDLGEIKNFVEDTYGINADRHHLEMLFLKVLPLASINSKVFLDALVEDLDDASLPKDQKANYDNLRKYWRIFLKRRLDEGYLLPGTVTDLGGSHLSWAVEWPKNYGVRSSTIFNDLQFSGQDLRAINDIPAFEDHPEDSHTQVTAMLVNEVRVRIDSTELELITLLHPGFYNVEEVETGHMYTLRIVSTPMNEDILTIVKTINELIQQYNSWQIARTEDRGLAKKTRDLFKGGPQEIKVLGLCRQSGTLVKDYAQLQHSSTDILASTFKLNGRKIPRLRAAAEMNQDLREIDWCLKVVKERAPGVINSAETRKRFRTTIGEIENHVAMAHITLKEIRQAQDIADEPIHQVLYPDKYLHSDKDTWFEYKAWYHQNQQLMRLNARWTRVSDCKWVADFIEAFLEGDPRKYVLVPLKEVPVEFRADEIKVGDVVALAGRYLIVATEEPDGKPGLFMTNYLRVANVDEQSRSRRGANRTVQGSVAVDRAFR